MKSVGLALLILASVTVALVVSFGCAAPGYSYPFSTSTPSVPVETNYPLNVVSKEMSSSLSDPAALGAQAIAARSYMAYHVNNNLQMNHSTSNASNAGSTPELREFGNPDANPEGGFGGAAMVEGVGQLIAIARVGAIVPNSNPVRDVGEDYNAIQLP
jgi:hypothetical protein